MIGLVFYNEIKNKIEQIDVDRRVLEDGYLISFKDCVFLGFL